MFARLRTIGELIKYARIVKKLSGKHRLLDMFFTRLRLGVWFSDYLDFGFYQQPWKVRKDYLYNEYEYHMKYNPGVTRNNHDDKRELVEKYKKYLCRDIISTNNLSIDVLKEFVNKHSVVFYKPCDGDSGKGIEKLNSQNYTDINEMYKYIQCLPIGILEEAIIQCDEMNKMNPFCVQTVRFTVFKHTNGARLIFTTLRTPIVEGEFKDNAGSGGVFANVDIDTGKVLTNAYSEVRALKSFKNLDLISLNGIERHPITNVKFKGFQIPYFNEAKDMALEIVNNVNFHDRRLFGLDICFSIHGPVLIEVNANRPDISGLWQTPLKHIALRPIFEEMIKE